MAEALPLLGPGAQDAVLLDLTLPDSRGVETFQVIQQHCPDTPVIVVTGENPQVFARLPALDGAAAIVSKASGPEAILNVLYALVGRTCEDRIADLARPALTPRERDILILCARGLQNKVIGRNLGISENTVRAHLASVFKRFGLTHRGEVKALLEQFGTS